VEMPRNTEKTVSFKHPAVDETVRGVKLGAEYTAENIDQAIKQNQERNVKNYADELRIGEKRTADTTIRAEPTIPRGNTGEDNESNIRNTRTANEPIGNRADESGKRRTKRNTGELHEKLQQIRGLDERFNPAEQRRIAEADELSARKIREKAERVRNEEQPNERESREEIERTKNEQRYIERENRNDDYEHER